MKANVPSCCSIEKKKKKEKLNNKSILNSQTFRNIFNCFTIFYDILQNLVNCRNTLLIGHYKDKVMRIVMTIMIYNITIKSLLSNRY